MTPLHRLAKIADEYALELGEENQDCCPAPEDLLAGALVLLVETNVVNGQQTWMTLHSSPEAACSANVDQEYAHEWQVDRIVDLADGTEYDVEYRAVAIARTTPSDDHRQYDPGTDAEYVDQITDAFIAAGAESPMDPTGIDCIERYEGGDS